MPEPHEEVHVHVHNDAPVHSHDPAVVVHTTHHDHHVHISQHPTARELDKEVLLDEKSRVHFVLTLTVSLLAMIFMLAALLTPRWLVNGNGVWGPLNYHGTCIEPDDVDCDYYTSRRMALLVLSFFEIFPIFATAILCAVLCCLPHRSIRIAAAVLAFVATLFALITLIIGGVIAQSGPCNPDGGTLQWAWALRFVETVIGLVLTVILVMRVMGRLIHGAIIALFLASLMTILCLASLVGVGWERRGPPNVYLGIWDICTWQGDACNESQDKLSAVNAMLAIIITFLAVFILLFHARVTYKALLPAVSIALIATIVAAIVFPAWAEHSRCGFPSPRNSGYDPAAGVGLFVVGGVFVVILFVLALLRVLKVF